MATTKKKAPARRKPAAKKTAAKTTHKGGRTPDHRTVKSPKVKANNRKFGKIQEAVLTEFYQAGKHNKPKPAVKATYKKVARRVLA